MKWGLKFEIMHFVFTHLYANCFILHLFHLFMIMFLIVSVVNTRKQ